jgi:hypothetical protein
MNERIRDLAITGGIYDCITDPYDKLKNGDPYSSVMIDLEKFAELIVAECISMADKESERYSNLDQEYCSMAMDNYRELVRKHFGVEE